MSETLKFISSSSVSSFLSYQEFISVVNPYRSLNFTSKHLDVVDQYIKDHPIFAMSKITNEEGQYVEGVCVWNNQHKVDRSILCLKKIDLYQNRVIAFRHPMNGSFSTPSREIENELVASNIDDLLQKKGMDYVLKRLPPLIGYQHGSTIVITEGARRLAGLHRNNIQFSYAWLEEINSEGDCFNLSHYASLTGKPEFMQAVAGYYNIPDYRVVPNPGFERKYFYPDLSKQVGALVKHTLGQDSEELVQLGAEIQGVKYKIPKE